MPDPTDAKADGNFGNHRAGYGDRLDRIIATARKGWTLAAGEGLVLVQEIDRLRSRKIDREDLPSALIEENKQLRQEIDRLREERDALQADILARSGFRTLWEIDHACVNNERDVALRILAKLREPSEAVVKAVKDAIYEELGIDYWDGKTRRILYYAVAAAEQEVR